MYSDRVLLSHITNDPTMGQDKVQSQFNRVNSYFSVQKSHCSSLNLLLLFLYCCTLSKLVYIGQPVFFSIKVYVTYIKPDQTMWYRACKTCNKKVTEAVGSGYWCEGCQKNDDQCSLR